MNKQIEVGYLQIVSIQLTWLYDNSKSRNYLSLSRACISATELYTENPCCWICLCHHLSSTTTPSHISLAGQRLTCFRCHTTRMAAPSTYLQGFPTDCCAWKPMQAAKEQAAVCRAAALQHMENQGSVRVPSAAQPGYTACFPPMEIRWILLNLAFYGNFFLI